MKCAHVVLLLLLTANGFAQAPWSGLLSRERATDWRGVGATIPTGTIPPCATQPVFGAGTDPAAAITTAFNADAGGASYCQINIPAGTYQVTGTLNFDHPGPANIIISGAGPDQTHFVWTAVPPSKCNGLSYTALCVWNGDQESDSSQFQFQNTAQVTGGLIQGSTQITLANISGPVPLKVGSLLEFQQADPTSDNGNAWFCGTAGFQGSCSQQGGDNGPNIIPGDPGYIGTVNLRANLSQLVLVTACGTNTTFGTSCSGNPLTVTISSPITAPNWSPTALTVATWSNRLPISNIGVEGMSLDLSNVVSNEDTGVALGIITECHLCSNAWFSNLAQYSGSAAPTNSGLVPGQAVSNHFLPWQSSHITIQHSYMYGSNAAANGYGIDWAAGTADSLGINNISQHIAAAYITEHGSRDVFAYNYAVDDFFGSNWQACDQTEHDAGDYDLLWEGNVGTCVAEDAIHGSHDFNTYYREYLSGFDPATEAGPRIDNTLTYQLMAYSRYINIVANVVGTAGFDNNYENFGLSGNPNSCPLYPEATIYSLNFGDQNQEPYSPTCIGSSYTIDNDELVAATLMRWGNYDVVTHAVREDTFETAAIAPVYPGLSHPSTRYPASFFLTAKPSWWLFPKGAMAPWPAIGPDVTGGNIAGTAGHAWLNPAANCYLNVLRGKVDGSSGPMYNFTADTCYGSVPITATPVISPAAGAYSAEQTVTINDSNPSAAIYYTIDGSTPTASSTMYQGPFTVSSTTTVNAIAVVVGETQSDVASALITIGSMTLVQHLWFEVGCSPTCPAERVAPTGFGNLLVISALETSANISSVSCSPNCGAWVLPGAVCQAASGYAGGTDCAYVLSSEPGAKSFTVTMTGNSSNTVLHFREFHSTVGASFRFDGAASGNAGGGTCFICVTPSLDLTGTNDVVIAAGTPGSVFVSVNPPYGDLQIDSQGTAVADVLNTTSGAGASFTQSNPNGDLAAYFTIAFTDAGAPVAVAPVFSPPGGNYNHPVTVKISDPMPGATIFYTTDGTAPTSSSTLYVGPIQVNTTETLKAITMAAGYANSAVVTAAYCIVSPIYDTKGRPCQRLDDDHH
jgi:hypothetical protein